MATKSLQTRSTTIVLTIAGSDSGGGAGIQADIKAISATGGYACSVITAITSQNTLGVEAIFPIPVAHIEKQLDAVFNDLNVVAVKVGMLADSAIIKAVATKIRQYKPAFFVVDPVMVATSGDLLLQHSAIDSLKSELFPLADVITPNLSEGMVLTGEELLDGQEGMDQLITKLGQLDTAAVLLKGGHLTQDSTQNSNSDDVLIRDNCIERLTGKRVDTKNTHGTGCTLSAAIASYLAQGHDLLQACTMAKHYLSLAIKHADELDIGHGRGPVNHFFQKNHD